jgi:hypothetical protein
MPKPTEIEAAKQILDRAGIGKAEAPQDARGLTWEEFVVLYRKGKASEAALSLAIRLWDSAVLQGRPRHQEQVSQARRMASKALQRHAGPHELLVRQSVTVWTWRGTRDNYSLTRALNALRSNTTFAAGESCMTRRF